MLHTKSKVTIHPNTTKVKHAGGRMPKVFARDRRFLNTNPLVYVFVSPTAAWG
jgi:hypothetical protein